MSGPILHLTILQSPVFLINSRLDLFTAASLRWRPFSRSYRSILPNSLAMNLSSTLGFSPRLPVSVYGTGCHNLKFRGFSRQLLGSLTSAEALVYFRILPNLADLPAKPIATYLTALFRKCEELSILRHPIETKTGAGILTSFPSATPFGFT